MNVKELKPYAEVFGIIAFVLAIAGFIIPIVGVLFITPIAIVLGILALLAGYKRSMSLATVIIIAVNLIVSPTFWLNMLGSALFRGNAILTLFDIVGVAVMVYLLAKSNKEPEQTDQK